MAGGEHTIRGRQIALANCERFIAPSKAIKAALVRNGLSEERVVVVPHGIEPFRKTPIEVIDGRPIRFGYVGRINRPKGLHILFQAFAPSSKIGPVNCTLLVRRNIGGKRTTWQMPCPVAQTTKGLYCMGKFRMTACTRPWRDRRAGLAEYPPGSIRPRSCGGVSAGRPVIVSDSCGVGEVVRHGVDGLIVERNNVEALAAAMRDLIASPEKILAMAARIRPVRTLAEHVDELEGIYDLVINERAPAVTGQPRTMARV